MFKRLRRGFFVGVALLFMLCLGFATPALAEGETPYDPSTAKLTAVIVAPVGTDVSGDKFVFHFDGGGTVTEQHDENGNPHVFSGNNNKIEQDNTTIKGGDVVPTIGDNNGNVELQVPSRRELDESNSLINEEGLGQTVVQKSMTKILKESEILVKNNEDVEDDDDDLAKFHVEKFPHAGVYIYEVTEKPATLDPSKAYVAPSQARFRLRICVKNANIRGESVIDDKSLAIDYVTVDRIYDDYEQPASGKTDPTYPKMDGNSGKITGTLDAKGKPVTLTDGTLAGDTSGRNVPGFTFANEYITTAPLKVKKLYDGNHADRTRYSTVELAVKASVSPDTRGGALTYVIEGGGADLTNGEDNPDYSEDEHTAEFDNKGWCYIRAGLKEGSSIRITGEFGPLVDGNRETLSTNGLFRGQTYYVLENNPGDYRPYGYVYGGSDSYTNSEGKEVYIDPRANSTGMSRTGHDDSPKTVTDEELEGTSIYGKEHGLNGFALLLINEATGNNTTIFVVNDLDDNKVSVTGIFVDNLPYILMIGVPLVVFAGMFVAKRRGNAA